MGIGAETESVLFHLRGAGAEPFAAGWTGTLCWPAPSPYRAKAGRKNWYVIAQPCSVDIPHTAFAEEDVDIVACRTGGPGGQHRNKVGGPGHPPPDRARRGGRHRAAVRAEPPRCAADAP